jgi:Glutaredoxin-like domain (DUF836)
MVVSSTRLTLLAKPGCHLCDDARDVIGSVLEQLGTTAPVTMTELSILDDAELNEKYWDEIPVVLINDRVHTIWRVDPDRLRTALLEAAS